MYRIIRKPTLVDSDFSLSIVSRRVMSSLLVTGTLLLMFYILVVPSLARPLEGNVPDASRTQVQAAAEAAPAALLADDFVITAKPDNAGASVDTEFTMPEAATSSLAPASTTFSSGVAITTSADGAWAVYAADIDSDGDMDVLSASLNDNTIAWHESDGAADPTFTPYVITTLAEGAESVYAADIDNDGDMDVLSASLSTTR